MNRQYKLLIVDDEKVIRRGMFYYDWERLGFEACAVAANGKQALTLFEEHQFDLVITDIRMPDMEGLELSKQIQSAYPECKVIILTGYRDFEYAKAAIQAGVVGYLLKPVDRTELDRMVMKVKADLDIAYQNRQVSEENEEKFKAARQLAINTFLRALIHERTHDPIQLEETASLLELSLTKANFCCGIIEVEPNLEMDSALRSFLTHKELGYFYRDASHRIIVIINYDCSSSSPEAYAEMQFTELYRVLRSIVPNQPEMVTIYVGPIYTEIDMLWASHQGADYLCQQKKFEDKQAVFFSWRFKSALNNIYSFELEQKLIQSILNGDKTNSLLETEKLWDYIMQSNPSQICKKLLQVLHLIEHHFGRYKLTLSNLMDRQEDYALIVETPSSLEDLKRRYMDFIVKTVDHLSQMFYTSISSTQMLMLKASEFIEANYDKKITLQDVAETIHLNPIYVSIQFKKNFGVNFVDFLKDLRITKAKNLLEQTNWKIQQIGETVGYQNAKYFSDLFKATTGMTPNEYRNNKSS
ncbi:response regulator [Paenibacillus sp. GCM10012307]|uniref:Response regulator n=1 Tax=Paenibacillus roseus TaxID=2798579 RepID=A0A934J3E1_9BACL|nr:response regulator [Paenibacillus roseus]MBJ6364022.1 response regulator [Paenibacillus roseus]